MVQGFHSTLQATSLQISHLALATSKKLDAISANGTYLSHSANLPGNLSGSAWMV
jgi:hypothetical protein